MGILTLLERDSALRGRMADAATFAWDANQSWIVLTAVGLWATLPGVTQLLLPALYLPLILMLFCLIARAVSIEFLAERREDGRVVIRSVELVFGWSSLVAVLLQGMAIGALLHGVEAADGRFTGGPFSWFSAYGLLTGVAALALQAMSGAVWAGDRVPDERLRARVRSWTRIVLPGTVVLLALAWVFLPDAATRDAVGGGRRPLIVVLAVLGLLAAAVVWRRGSTGSGPAVVPVLGMAALKVVGVVGVAALVYPEVVPGALSLTQAAADPSSIGFFLVAAGVLLPIVAVYNIYSYVVFCRPARPAEGVPK